METPRPERAQQVIDQCLTVVRERYGDGSSMEGRLQYHNERHTRDSVMENLRQLVHTFNRLHPEQQITPQEEELLMLAAAGHDRVQLVGPGENERRSADEIADDMRQAGYSETEIAFVRAGILATIPDFAPGKITQPMREVQTMLDRGEITPRQFELAKLIADADLGVFGTTFEKFYYVNGSLNLFYEIRRNQNKSVEPVSVTKEEILTWLKGQRSVIASHQWVSDVGAETFPDKEKVLAELDDVIAQVEAPNADIAAIVTPRF